MGPPDQVGYIVVQASHGFFVTPRPSETSAIFSCDH